MKERPIIMSGESVRAILEGRKTQTRRVVKKDIVNSFDLESDGSLTYETIFDGNGDCVHISKISPYGQAGDRLWVRERFSIISKTPIIVIFEAADYANKEYQFTTPLFMPRWASRITLEITDIRVERLQDITEEDARKEGMRSPLRYVGALKDAYKTLWNSINTKRGFPWESNPFVWVVEFKVVNK